MKTLILMRHAKSSWDHLGLRDLDRPLNLRGERDAPFMGSHFSEWGLFPDLLVASPAVRAQETAKRVAQVLNYPETDIATSFRLYEAGISGVIAAVQTLPSSASTACLFGHNPDISDAAAFLAGEDPMHLPTAALVSLVFAVDDWAAVMPGSGRINRFEYPKRYRESER
jgi:phosphohistidine phosphatase